MVAVTVNHTERSNTMAGKKPKKTGSDLPKPKLSRGTSVPKNPTKKPFGEGGSSGRTANLKKAK